MTDLTRLLASLKRRSAHAKEFGHDVLFVKIEDIDALVEALEKAQQSEEVAELLRDKVKRLESDLWNKEQLRKVHSEKSFELEGKIRELEARNQKDFAWRGEEIGRLNDEIDDLKGRLESRTVTVKLPKRSVGEVMHMSGFSRDYAEGWCAGNDNAIHEMRVAGVNVIEGEQNNG